MSKIYKNEVTIKWNIDLDNTKDIERQIVNKFYELGLIFESLEGQTDSNGNKIISGNGHHKAQEISEYAKKIFNRDKNK